MRNLLALAVAAAFASAAAAQQNDGTSVSQTIHVHKPRQDAPRAEALRVPDGFEVGVFAKDLKNVRMLAVAPDGAVYATRREQGDVLRLLDADGDGRADGPPQTVVHRPQAHGIAIHDGKLWLATVKEVFAGELGADGGVGELRMLIGDLPDGGQHPNRTLGFGPDGWLYLSVGSTCNACNETNPEHATMLRVKPDGQSRSIFASGLRNTIGFGWHPATGELWGMDHGIDDLGDDRQHEELNRLQNGRKYGWPHVFDKDGLHPQTTPPGGVTKEAWRAQSEPMVMGYTAHAAPMQLAFYNGGNFGREYQGDAFVAMRGSWNRKPASGYEVVRIDFDDKGAPQRIEPFLTGFLAEGGNAITGRPVGVAQAKDGALLVADDTNGVIYRIARTGKLDLAPAKTPPADAMQAQTTRGLGVPLAFERLDARGELAVTSVAFEDGNALPAKYSEYHDGLSPPLQWTAVEGAKSYLVICEDPDAKPVTPFVHWVAWNIPATVTALPEGLQEQLRLTEPEDLRQGKTSRHSIGYMGPKPPVGDPPHHYHFQVFALDTVLDVAPGADRDAVLAAAKGHVLAKGRIVGTYRQERAPLK